MKFLVEVSAMAYATVEVEAESVEEAVKQIEDGEIMILHYEVDNFEVDGVRDAETLELIEPKEPKEV